MAAADKSTSWLIKLVDKVTAPLKGILKSVTATTQGLDRAVSATSRLDANFGGLGRTIKSLGIGVALTGLSMSAMSFEHSLAASNTIMKKTPQEFAAVTDEVRELSKNIPLVRDQISGGLYEVLSAGVPQENAIQFLNDSAKAAVAGQADLGEVVRTTTSIIKAYGFEFNKQAEIQDRMQKAVDLGQMTMGEFASALPHATVLAGNLNVGIDELMGAFATMTGVTGNASEVSTQLAAIMSGMINPSSEATEVVKKLGIAFNANSIRDAGGLNNYLSMLMPKIDALAKRSNVTRESLIAKLFGREEAVRGILGLTGQLADTWTANTSAMATSAGSVSTAFDIMNETTQSKIQSMQNSMLALWDKLFLAAAPTLNSIIAGLSSVFEWLGKFPQEHPYLFKTIEILAMLAIAVWAVQTAIAWAAGAWQFFMFAINEGIIFKIVGFIITLGAAIFGLQAPFWAATSSTWALNTALYANPIGLIILAITALIALVVVIIKKWDEWGAALAVFLGPLGLVISLIQSLRRNWEMVKEAFKTDGILGGLKAIGKTLLDAILMPLQQLLEIVANVTGFEWAKNAAAGIQSFRESMGTVLNPTAEGEQPATEFHGRPAQGSYAPPTPTPKNIAGGNTGSGGGLEMDGTSMGKQGAIVNQTITFNLDFSKHQGDIKKLTEEVVANITDLLSDATLMTVN